MKVCPECGTRFVGMADRCDVCRRRPRPAPRKRVTQNVTSAALADTHVTKAVTPGEPCPTCGRPAPMTAAERQRRRRARKKETSDG